MSAEDRKDLWEILDSVPFVIWFCPDRGEHERNREKNAPQQPTVKWVDGVAHCLEPGCGRESTDKKEER